MVTPSFAYLENVSLFDAVFFVCKWTLPEPINSDLGITGFSIIFVGIAEVAVQVS